ncbi:ribosome recycling factor [Candidatus Wolfebacteria bacterium]|nr:ribosome recycling factor [Candidatus Wolfebacteria bacterium]
MDELKAKVLETKEWLIKELSGIRTGRAAPQILENVRVEVYGVMTPLAQVATVGVEDAKTLTISPWDKENAKHVEKALAEADLGVSVQAGDTTIRVIFPDLTQERRDMLIKLAGDRLEQAKVTLRGVRNDALSVFEKQKKDSSIGEDEFFGLKDGVQKIIDGAIKDLEELGSNKKKEISE